MKIKAPLEAANDKAIKSIDQRLEALRVQDNYYFDYVLVRAEVETIQEALEKLDIQSAVHYRRPKELRDELELLARELRRAQTTRARLMLDAAAPDAVRVKVAGLRSRSERIKQAAASDILDRTIGSAKDKQGGPAVGVAIQINWDGSDVLRAARVIEGDVIEP